MTERERERGWRGRWAVEGGRGAGGGEEGRRIQGVCEAETNGRERTRKEDYGSLFRPLSCHLNSYNANGARVTSGGIPA